MFDTDEYLWIRDLAIIFGLLAVFGAALGASLFLWS